MWGVDIMREFIDETTEKDGTEINRSNMMALQGYQGENVTFGETITKTNDKGEVETITFSGNKIFKNFVGEKTINQTITFSENGYTKELN
jgi:hypothetical protein